MNKILGLAFVAFTGYNVYCSQSKATVSDVLLENVEAFGYINPEIEDFQNFYLKEYSSICKICENGSGTCNVHSQLPCYWNKLCIIKIGLFQVVFLIQSYY